ncbi:hypothetical protein HYV83_03090 [Candidatus Woesearchaeota archaeon]|nr:hypothetical protein [Candidatus Woesearchaeota archaeon]
MKFLHTVPAEILGLGLYRSLTLIGIGIGVWLFLRGIQGNTLWPIILLLVGLFMTIKELMDMMHYTSLMNLVGVGTGIVVVVLAIAGTVLPPLLLAALGAFVAGKEVMDLMHSG